MSTEDVENWMKRDRNRQETEKQSQNVKLNKEGQTYMYVTKCDWFYQTYIWNVQKQEPSSAIKMV